MDQTRIMQPGANGEVYFESRSVSSKSASYSLGKSKVCPKSLEVIHKRIKQIERKLNNRPRKRLGYRTPLEVYKEIVALAA